MEVKYFNNNLYFSGYKSSKYMKGEYAVKSLLDSGTKDDEIPDGVDIQDNNVIWGLSSDRLKGIYNYFGFSNIDLDSQIKARIQEQLDIVLERLSQSGVEASNLDMIARLVDDKKLSIQVLATLNKDFKISRIVSDDLDKLYEAYINKKDAREVFVPMFENQNEAFENINTGDICQIRGNENISIKMSDGSIRELFISPETYLELFPPVERFITVQQDVGDCYLLSALNSINENPIFRYKILEMFRENPDGTVDIVFEGFENKDGNIVPKNPDNLVVGNIESKMPKQRKDYALSGTCEGVGAIELLSECQNQYDQNHCTEKMYDDFKQNGMKTKRRNFRKYTEDELKYFISYIDNHGLSSMFCLQDNHAIRKFSLTKEQVIEKIEELEHNEDDGSKYKVLILQRMLDSMNRTGAPCDSVFGDTMPKAFLTDFFKEAKEADLYYNNSGHPSDVYKQFGLDVIFDKAYINEAKEELFAKNPKQYVFTCSTIKEKAMKSDGKFMPFHTYSIEPVDIKGERKFAIKDPHNTMEEIILSYEELCEYFNKITVAKI